MPVITHSNNSVVDSFYNVKNIVVYRDGEIETYSKGDDKYQQIFDSLIDITENSHEMPAFGVSIDNETREAMKTGLWIELEFNGKQECNGMPFESLLININADHSGFNLIRKYNGRYDGRCFYLYLENDMQILYDTIMQMS